MGILDNAKLAELGKKTYAGNIANNAIQTALPEIQAEAARDTLAKYGNKIHQLGESKALANLGIDTQGQGLAGLSGYGFKLT